MTSRYCIALLSLAVLGSTSTVQLDIHQDIDSRNAQLQRRAEHNLSKRGGTTLTISAENMLTRGLYFTNVTIGTPPQNLALQIDTGSSDTWAPSSSSSLCEHAKEDCSTGSFLPSQSSSFQVVGPDEFNISYVDGTGAKGDYFQDNFSVGGATLSQFEMGLARDTTIGTGIMGIGYNNSEANVNIRNGGNGTVYQNLPIAMVNQNEINSAAYSLWLNDLQSSSGSILFGGIDTAKYNGDLISVNVYPTSHRLGVTSFTVAFTSLSATSSSGTDQLTPPDYAVAAILDSGTTITLLPDDIAALVYEELGAIPEPEIGAVVVPCALSQASGTLNYGFGGPGGPVIKVEVSDLVLPLTDSKGRGTTFKNGQPACQLGIQAAGSLPVLFGDTFLRSAYAVYDLINNRIGLAQTNFNATGSNIVPFPSFGAPIPNALTAQNEAQVTQTASGPSSPYSTGSTIMPMQPPAATTTDLNASGGFESVATSTGNAPKKHNSGNARPYPTAWIWLAIGILNIFLMGVGSAIPFI